MWCPSCQSRSPLVAIQPEGLICARCQIEVEFGERIVGKATDEAKRAGPHYLRLAFPAKIADASSLASTPIVNSASVAEVGAFQTAAVRSCRVASEAESPAFSKYSDCPGRESIDKTSRENVGSAYSSKPELRPLLMPQQPLYRFDAAHPPVGGLTQAAIDLQRGRLSSLAAEASVSEARTATQENSQASTQVQQSPALDGMRPIEPILQKMTPTMAEQDSVVIRELASLSESKPKKEAIALPEFELRPVPRSFLFPRKTNRWPGRFCLLSGGLFFSGQGLLLNSFLRAEAMGVATGILASAVAFALAQYMIARYCDEELER